MATKTLSRPSRGQLTAQGVFSELAAVKPVLDAQRRIFTPNLSKSIYERAYNLIPGLGIKGLSEQTRAQVAGQIASQATQAALEKLGRVQDEKQIPQVIADSLTESIAAHPAINPDLDQITQSGQKPKSLLQDEEKIYQKVEKAAADIAEEHQANLEKAAVLENMAKLSEIPESTEAQKIVGEQIDSHIKKTEPLDPSTAKETIKGDSAGYLYHYGNNLVQSLGQISESNIPNLSSYTQIKQSAHDAAQKIVQENAPKVASRVSTREPIEEIAKTLSLKPLSETDVETFGLGRARPNATAFATGASLSNFGMGVAVAINSEFQREAYLSALAHDQDRLNKALEKEEQELENLKKARSLAHSDRIKYLNLQKRVNTYRSALDFRANQPQKYQSYVTTFLNLPLKQRLNWTEEAWLVTQASFGAYPGVYVPQPPARRLQSILPRRTAGGLSAQIGKFSLGAVGSTQSVMAVGKVAGAEVFAPMMIAQVGIRTLKNMAKAIGSYLFGLLLYAWYLGQAALAGAIIGGLIGAGVGAGLGLIASAVCGPFAAACAFITVPAGVMIGGAIGATVGTLIGYGLAAGNATAVSMGVGAGVGGISGAVTGAYVGAAIGSLIPIPIVGTLVGGLIGATIGAFIGMGIGGAIGYAIGHYVIPVFENAFGFFSGSLAASGGLLASFGSFLTGLASNIWGGLVSAGGSFLGGLGSLGGALWGGLTSLGAPASMAAIPVFGAFGAITIGGIIVGITTAATFFNSEHALAAQQATGENAFYKITKTASPTSLNNPDLATSPPPEITYQINIQAKDVNLINISLVDNLTVSGANVNINIARDKDGKPISPPCSGVPNNKLDAHQAWTCEFRIQTGTGWQDSWVRNTINVQATPEGQSQPTIGSATAPVKIGNPPTNCPQGWPIKGHITQGPDGHTSHGDHNDLGYPPMEAIDIATHGELGWPIYSTFDGEVSNIVNDPSRSNGSLNQILYIKPTACPNPDLIQVSYHHVSAIHVSMDQTVHFGDHIADSGDPLCGGPCPHLHYQFNPPRNRNFRMEPPNIPEALPVSFGGRACDPDCGIEITSIPF